MLVIDTLRRLRTSPMRLAPSRRRPPSLHPAEIPTLVRSKEASAENAVREGTVPVPKISASVSCRQAAVRTIVNPRVHEFDRNAFLTTMPTADGSCCVEPPLFVVPSGVTPRKRNDPPLTLADDWVARARPAGLNQSEVESSARAVKAFPSRPETDPTGRLSLFGSRTFGGREKIVCALALAAAPQETARTTAATLPRAKQ
jgi:hypothetical protein